MKRLEAVALTVDELIEARGTFPPFNSQHEGYAVILEELDELWEAIRANPRDRDAVRDEAVQVAAMALRFLTDTCEGCEEGDR